MKQSWTVIGFNVEWVNTQKKNLSKVETEKENAENFEEKDKVIPQAEIKREEKSEQDDKLQGEEIERLNFRFTRYYSPVKWQKFRYTSETYDFNMNCQGNCLRTADWHELKQEEAWKVVACPKDFPSWTRIYIENYWEVVCHDRGAWINKDKNGVYHLDLWCGIWEQGVLNIKDQKQKTYCYNPWPRKWYVIK